MEQSTPRPRVLLVGDVHHPEFSRMCQWLAAVSEVEMLRRSDEIADPMHVDTIVFFQSRPGQFAQATIERLHRAFPFADLLAVLGSWCEGETRSGRPWHGVERTFWYEAKPRLETMLRQPRRPMTTRTETMAERVERRTLCPREPSSRGMALVVARTRNAFEPLADACVLYGFTPRWHRRGPIAPDPQIILWDADDLADHSWLERLTQLGGTPSQAHLVALLNFPRREEAARLIALGCRTVLGKPVLLPDLFACLGPAAATVPRPSAA